MDNYERYAAKRKWKTSINNITKNAKFYEEINNYVSHDYISYASNDYRTFEMTCLPEKKEKKKKEKKNNLLS